MNVEFVQGDKREYDGKKMIIWAPECSMTALECLGVRAKNDSDDSLSVR